MSIHLPRDLFTQIFEDPAVNPASRRKVVLPRITRQILEQRGYKFSNKIRVPGGYAYEAVDPSGAKVRLGLKTAVNRWLNTATTLVKMVDTVIVTTFEWDVDDEKPEKLELIEISSAALLKMIDKVKAAAAKRGWDRDGHYYMPLDASALEEDHVGCVAGAVIPTGQVLFGPEKVIWVADDWGNVGAGPKVSARIDIAAGASDNPRVDVAGLVAQAKVDLAAKLGISSDKIDVSIRF